ncbi:hypothetical protein DFH11DRAFT_1553514 [Phellopilus nigrolimitatus]|nr:hypothetical protein DFH11DRAFT_1553514 [Phellopilus nigrolimitatus]
MHLIFSDSYATTGNTVREAQLIRPHFGAFRSAIQYIQTVRTRLAGDPTRFALFLGVLFSYDSELDNHVEVHRLMQEVFAGEPHLLGEFEAKNASRIRILRNPEPGPAKTSKLCPSSKPPSGVWDKEGLAMMLSDNIRRESAPRGRDRGARKLPVREEVQRMWLMTQRRHAAKRSANNAPVPKRAVWEPCLHTSAFPAPPANREPQATNTADSGK